MNAVASVDLQLTPTLSYLLRPADTALIHAQRLTEWCGHGPVLEEDIALSNMALDLLGQARALLAHAATVAGQAGQAGQACAGLDEDQLAFLRDEGQFLNFTLAELPLRKPGAHSSAPASGGDFADTVLRNFLLATWFKALWTRAVQSTDSELAGIAAKALKEARYHQQHAGDWVVRLGDGTAESARRMQAALQRAWPYTTELFAHDAVDEAALVSGLGPARRDLQADWQRDVDNTLAAAQLQAPAATPFISTGSTGLHSEHLGHVLAEMQFLQRRFPGGRW